jgi:hypothetical protein
MKTFKRKVEVDKPIVHIIEEFNKSKYVKTVFSCGGHFNKKNLDPQVYIMFEMDKIHIGNFLAIAFNNILNDSTDVCLAPQLGRVLCEEWPMENRERLTLSFYDIHSKLQMQSARNYFDRLSIEVSATL